MLLVAFFFGLGFFLKPFPYGLLASLAGGAFGAYLVKDRYLETKRLAGNNAYYKVLASSFTGTAIVYFIAMSLGYGLSHFFSN